MLEGGYYGENKRGKGDRGSMLQDLIGFKPRSYVFKPCAT